MEQGDGDYNGLGRRDVLRKAGTLTAVTGSLGSGGLHFNSSPVLASGTTLNKGDQVGMSNSAYRECSYNDCDDEWHADNRWSLEVIARGDNYISFQTGGLFHIYESHPDRGYSEPCDWITGSRMSVEVEYVDDNYGTSINEENDVDGQVLTSESSLNDPDWRNWYGDYQGNPDDHSKQDIENKYDTQNYEHADVPLWVDAAAWIAGAGATFAATGGATLPILIGGSATAVSGMLLADEISRQADSCSGGRTGENKDTYYYDDWEYCENNRALVTNLSMFTVYVGDEASDLNLKIYNGSSLNYNYEDFFGADDEHGNVGCWEINIPSDPSSEDPYIKEKKYYYDRDGHSQP